MSSEVKNPAAENFRFSLGDFQNPVKISSRSAQEGNFKFLKFLKIFKRPLASPRFALRKPF